MNAFTICCMISSRLMRNLGLFLVYQDQQKPRSHEHHDVLPRLGDGKSSKNKNFWASNHHNKPDL
jgi:hypothetical protein